MILAVRKKIMKRRIEEAWESELHLMKTGIWLLKQTKQRETFGCSSFRREPQQRGQREREVVLVAAAFP